MATLEVHDGQGRVEYVAINRETPVLFGADPKCDVVLNDPKALPFHGRIRWRRGKFRVEAFPEARALEVSGKKVVATRFLQGDEVRVGTCRIFMLNPEDKPPDAEPTIVRPPPKASPTPVEARPKPLPRRRSRSDQGVEPPQAEFALVQESDPALSEATIRQGMPSRVVVLPTEVDPWWRRALRAVAPNGQAPGQERIATSPVVLGLVGVLVVLVVTGFSLWGIIARTTADRLFLQASDSEKNGEFLNAIRLYDLFLKGYPKDPRAGKARVHRALANVQQYASGAGPIWSNALEAAQTMVREVGRVPEYRDARMDLAELVLKTAEGLADRAKTSADPKTLNQARQAAKFHEQVAGQAAKDLQLRSRLPAKLADAEAAVVKDQARIKAVATMDEAIAKGSAAGVFAARDGLVERYPDFASHRDVVARMTKASDLIRQAVTFSQETRAAESTPVDDPLGPPTSLVLRSRGSMTATPDGPIVYALEDGLAYGLDGATGAPLWQLPVGASSPFPPQAVPGGGSTALVVDARVDALVCLDGRTGRLIWRQDLGEPVKAPPLVLGNQIVQATPTGKVLLIDLNSGELRGTFDLGLPLTQTPVADETGRFFYVLADRSSLFILRRDPPECVEVEYLGHDPGSIACPPARLGPYLIVAENHAPRSGRWTVFLLEADGGKARKVQVVPVSGWTWGTPASSGSVVWSADDRGGVAAFAVGPPDSKAPLSPIAELLAEDRISGPAFARARTERELWLASGRTARLDLDVERGTLTPAWTLGVAGPARAPLQVAGRLEVLAQQWTEGPGQALWGVNPGDGSVVWKTVLGTPWITNPSPTADLEGLVTLATDGRPLVLDRSVLQNGGFMDAPLLGPGEPGVPLSPLGRLEKDGLTVIAPAIGSAQIMVQEGDAAINPVVLPSPLAALPLFWGAELLIPGEDGRVYLIDPKSGLVRAEPFVPPFDRDRPTHWRTPVRLDDEAVALADSAGRVRRLTRSSAEAGGRLIASDPMDLGSPLAADPASTGEALVVATVDGKVRVLAARDLSPSGAYTLDAGRRFGPVGAAGFVFVGDADGRLLAFGPDGGKLWTADLADALPAGPPVVKDGAAWFLGLDGSLHRLDLNDGSPLDRVELNVLPAGGPLAVGSALALPTGRGTLRLRP